MASRHEARARLLNLLQPPTEGDAIPTPRVDMNRFALMILMCTHAPLFAATFPASGDVNPNAVYATGWFTEDELPPSVIAKLRGSRATLASAQLAWYLLSDEYEDPPCPSNERFANLVHFIKQI